MQDNPVYGVFVLYYWHADYETYSDYRFRFVFKNNHAVKIELASFETMAGCKLI